jgi:hypothetical protein
MNPLLDEAQLVPALAVRRRPDRVPAYTTEEPDVAKVFTVMAVERGELRPQL